MRCGDYALRSLCTLVLASGIGCRAAPQTAGTGPAGATQPVATAPAEGADVSSSSDGPAAYDPSKAFLRLSEILPAVSKPAAPKAAVRLPPQAVRQLVAGRKLFNERRYTEAILDLEKAFRYAPNDPQIHTLIALACQESGNQGRGVVHVDKALAANPDDVVGHYLRGTNALSMGELDRAIEHLRVAALCSNARPDNPYAALVRYRLAGALQQAGYLSAAIEQYDTFERLTTDPPAALLENAQLAEILRLNRGLPAQRIGEAYLVLGKTAEAADALGRASRLQPSDPRLRVRHGKALIGAKRFDDAIAAARDLIREFPEVAEGTDLLVRAYEAAGRGDAALVDLQELAAAQADNVPLTLTLADTLSQHGRHEQAVGVLRGLIDRQPEALDGYWKLVSILSEAAPVDAVLDVLARAVRAAEHAHVIAAEHTRKLTVARPEAIRAYLGAFDAHLERAATDFAYGFVLGTLAGAVPAVAEAERAYRSVVATKPEFVPAHLALGELYLDRFKWNQALEIAQTVARAGNKRHTVERLLARAYDGLDQVDQAVEHYKAALRLYSRDTTTLWLLAQLYERTGNPNQAQQRYREILRLEPHHDRARVALVRNHLRRHNLKEAQSQLDALRKRQGTPAMVGRCEALVNLASGRRTPKQFRQRLTDLLEKHGEDVETRIDLATSLADAYDYEAALQQLAEAKKRGPLPAAGLEVEAFVLRRRLEYDACEALYGTMLARHPNREAWLERHYDLQRIRQDYDKAVEVLKGLLARQDDKARRHAHRERLLLTLQRSERYAEAVELARSWYDEAREDAALRRLLTVALLAAGAPDEAVALAREWYGASPDDVSSRSRLLATLGAAKRFDEARLVLLEWLADDPENKRLSVWFSGVLHAAEAHDGAIEWLRNAHASAAADRGDRARRIAREWQERLLNAYRLSKRYDEAIRLLRSMVRERQLQRAVKLSLAEWLGEVLRRAERFDEAERHILQTLEDTLESETSMQVLFRRQLGYVYQQSGQSRASELQMLKALEISPHHVGVCNDLGYSWADAGRNLDRAEEMIRFAVGQAPDEAAYLDSFGWVLYKKGDFVGAKRWLERATRALNFATFNATEESSDPVILDHLGDALWQCDEKDAAVESWRQAVKRFKDRAKDAPREDAAALALAEKKIQSVAEGTPPPVADVIGSTVRDDTSDQRDDAQPE